MAQQCDPTAHLVPRERAAQVCLKLVDPDQLSEAVSGYIDWEALSYWAQPALERGRPLSVEVTQELNGRCPGFLEQDHEARHDTTHGSEAWRRLMLWVGDHRFQEAKNEGWFDAILIQKQSIHGQYVYVNFSTTVAASGVKFFHPHTPRSINGAEMLTLTLSRNQ